MRIQPKVEKEGLCKNRIYDVYSKYSNGSVSVELNGKFINLKSGEFKDK